MIVFRLGIFRSVSDFPTFVDLPRVLGIELGVGGVLHIFRALINLIPLVEYTLFYFLFFLLVALFQDLIMGTEDNVQITEE